MSKSTMNIQLNALTIFSVLSFFFIVLFVFNNKDDLLEKKTVQVKEQQVPLLVVSPITSDPIIQYSPSLEKPPIVEQEKALDKQNQEKVEKKPTLTPEQQAAIDAIDQPILDEHNTDVAPEIANADADEATPDTEVAASEAVTP